MTLSALFKKPESTESVSPARAAYDAHKQTLARLHTEHRRLHDHDAAERAAIAEAEAAIATPAALRNDLVAAEIDAQVDSELHRDTGARRHIDDLRARLADAEQRAAVAAARIDIEREKHRRLLQQIADVRARMQTEAAKGPPLLHAALTEDLAAEAPALAAARDGYIAMLCRTYALGAVLDELAHDQPQLGFVGRVPFGTMIFPKPNHAAFTDIARSDLHAQLAAAIQKVREAL